ncbi:MAG TPA: MBL fold metallo-hydrolase [Vicinamibacterales bacterium]|nr:MBL fold metallo-hydrolase [Vicinamibacterales bacterium]
MRVLSIGLIVIVAIASLRAQQPAAPPAKPDTAAVVQRIAALKAAAGGQWADTVRFWCEAPRANRADDPVIEPVRIFDNVYAIGSIGTVAYVIQTSAGLIMIDALSPNELESRLLPGFARLGLDPAQVKIVLVAHGHADHFGGAGYFQQRFGARVYVSPPDWDLMETPARGRGPAPAAAAAPPKRDANLEEGSPITLGDVTVRAVAVPGHTPGSMGFIFPVLDRGQKHVAALFGGSWLTPGLLSDDAMGTFIGSVARFKEATRTAGVDAWLQNHPLMVPFQEWVSRLGARSRTDPNPFVVGAASYQTFLDVLDGCSRVALERRRQ